MSAIEFGLAPQIPFVETPSQVLFEEHYNRAKASVIPYEELSQVSRLMGSMTHDTRLKQLIELSGSLVSTSLMANAELGSFLKHVTKTMQRIMTSDFAVIGQSQVEDGRFQVMAFDTGDDSALTQQSIEGLAEGWGNLLSTGEGWTGKLCDLNANDAVDEGSREELSMQGCVLPLVSRERLLGVFALGKRGDFSYTRHELEYLRQISNQVALVLENFLLHTELRELKEGSEDEAYPADEPSSEAGFEKIIGRSAALQRVLRQVEVVAPTDSGVLIQGETGTGKELIAKAIHNRSTRRDRPFIKVNCAAIPSGLLESELFGHEKGAFTGAIARKPGRFELADKGTLFLDEVGDIPLDLQAKLLRVLQEHEFERLGSTRTQQVDVRVVAATHRDLKQMVEEGTFRSDLYYRLHVFPLVVPPLRDRGEDIPFIVRHFVGKYSQRMNRHIETISTRTMEVLTNYAWPGNVRELQNFIERAVILSPGTSLRAPVEELAQETVQGSQTHLSTLEEMEREHVLRALKESSWVTGGPKGAAVKLGMKRTTLAYRIRKLGIPVRPRV
ncbi:MAG TPA: sigma 54-interacting transcriptional regulator [Candidatus Acidoferrum sp.]|nr:sigma 54-interacting transcriptional regulator [Candidatus Acidoferrum sp.]